MKIPFPASLKKNPVLQFLILELLLLSVFFFPLIFQNQVLFFGDTLTQRIPQMVFWRTQVLSGHLPLWNPYLFAGLPHLADLSTNSLSPFNLVYLVISDPFRALGLLVILDLFIGSTCMYFFLNQNRYSHAACVLGACLFGFSGTTLAAVNDINSLNGIVLIPLVLLAAKHLIDRPGLKTCVLVSLALTLQFISGHPQYSYYTWLILTGYLVICWNYPLIKKTKSIVMIFMIFFGLSAVQLLPFLELSGQTFRPDTAAFRSQNSLQILDLPRLLIADIYGNWHSGTSWGPNSPLETGRANTEGYLGLIALILVFIASKRPRTRLNLYFLFIMGLALLAAFGPALPFYRALNLLPLFSKFRSPARLLSLYSLAVSILAASGFNRIQRKFNQ
jgi:hypothetical protein